MGKIKKVGAKVEASKKIKIIAKNKRAHHDYFILETLECGIVLKGTEIKSIRMGKVSIQDAYCQIKNGSFLIHNSKCTMQNYMAYNIRNHRNLM